MSSTITISQIKAARSLLNWNQDTLAKKSNMSITALANLERNQSVPRISTLNSIKSALENAGIEFISNNGVLLRQDSFEVKILHGNDAVNRLWEDTYNSLNSGDERLISGVDESLYFNAIGKENMIRNATKLEKKGIKTKILCFKYNPELFAPFAEYRIQPNEFLHDVPYYVYGDKYAILLWKPEPKAILIQNREIADNFRKEFYAHWKVAQKI